MRGMAGMVLLAAAISSVTPAGAQVDEDIIAARAGDWLVLPVDGRPGCPILLTTEETIGGRLAVPADACAQHVPEMAEASAWYPSEGIVFADAIRRRLLAFEEDETTLLSSPSVADPAFYLVPAQAGLTHVPQAAEMPGAWRLSAGAAACTLRLEAGGELHAGPECRGAGLPAGVTRWRLEALGLLFDGENDAFLRLQVAADGKFAVDDGKQVLARGTP